MILIGAKIVDENFVLRKADIEIDDDKIIRVEDKIAYSDKELVIDCDGFTILPGFVDIHNHGCLNFDVSEGNEDGIRDMAQFLLSKGVTTFCPTTMTVSVPAIKKALETVKTVMDEDGDGAAIGGVNLEGPFVSKAKKGAQNEDFVIKPDFDTFKELFDSCGGIIKLVDMAPECDDEDMSFIKNVSKYAAVSVAHTTADYDTAIKSFDAGIRHATHLFNAMTGFSHRAPGVVGAVFEDERVMAELICDGHHVHPSVVKTVFKLMGDRIAVISDSIALNGMPEGSVGNLGGQEIIVKNKLAVLPDGTIAGSVSNLHEEFKNLVSWGIPMGAAAKAVSFNPAKAIGLDDKIGSIKAGKKPDLVVLDDKLEIAAVYH